MIVVCTLTGMMRTAPSSLLRAVRLADADRRALGPGVVGVALDRPAGLVYASDPAGRRIHVLRLEDLVPLADVGDASFVGPRGLDVDPDLRRVYVARSHRCGSSSLDGLTVIQRHATGRHSIDRTVPVAGGVRPWYVAVEPHTGLVLVAGRGERSSPPALIVLDRLTLDQLARMTIEGRPVGLRVGARPGVAEVELATGIRTYDVARVVDGRADHPAGTDGASWTVSAAGS